MDDPNFDESNLDYWKSLGPQEGMQRMFQYLIADATSTRDNKATDPEAKTVLTHAIRALQRDYLVIKWTSVA